MAISIAIIGEFKGLYILIMTGLYEGGYGIIVGRDFLKEWKFRAKVQSPKGEPNTITKFKVIGIIGIMMVGFLFSFAWTFDTRTAIRFSVSEQTMQDKELVLYWVRQDLEDPQAFVDVLSETNTVLALQGNPDLFQEIGDYTIKGASAAYLVQLCNLAGVKVEIWPVPSQNYRCALSMRDVDCMPVVYEMFSAWKTKYNLTIDYYAFDIEDSQSLHFENSTFGSLISPEQPLYWTFRGIYEHAAGQEFIRNERANWTTQLSKQQALIDRIRADGIIPRATIQPLVWDALDGDFDEFVINNMQSYEISGYDYLSGMYYRSCEWGNNDSTYLIYRSMKMLNAVSPYGKSAICLGCIGYPAYQTKEDIANDVWLSVGIGADSVRLFLGDSWVYRESTEAAGIESLREMLTLCRNGGTGTTTYTSSNELSILEIVINDIINEL
jgi:hypothetical protein